MSGAPLVLEVPDLATERVVLRPWQADDAVALSRAWHDDRIVAGSEPPADRSPDAAADWIAGWHERRLAGLAFDLVVADPADDRVLGEVGLSRLDPVRRAAMIGWWLHAANRGQGIATDAVSLLTTWLLDTGRLETLIAEIGTDNPASVRVAERCGYRRLPSRNPQEPARGGAARVWYVAVSTVK